MAIREVVHFVCDAPGCENVPCMTYEQAIEHAETHKYKCASWTDEYIWEKITRR